MHARVATYFRRMLSRILEEETSLVVEYPEESINEQGRLSRFAETRHSIVLHASNGCMRKMQRPAKACWCRVVRESGARKRCKELLAQYLTILVNVKHKYIFGAGRQAPETNHSVPRNTTNVGRDNTLTRTPTCHELGHCGRSWHIHRTVDRMPNSIAIQVELHDKAMAANNAAASGEKCLARIRWGRVVVKR